MASADNSTYIPEKQWAQVFEKSGGPITYREIPVPEPEPDELLVKIQYTGVCHTDIHAWQGDWPLETVKPLVGGHEGVGLVVKMGSLVRNFKEGDKVGIPWINKTCGTCPYCLGGKEQLCPHVRLSGYMINGTFQQFARVAAAQAARIPQHVNLRDIAPIMCAGLTVYNALKISGARPGQTVTITGAGGGLGSYGVQYAKAMGLRVIAIDTGEEKANTVKTLGADAFVDFKTTQDLIKAVKSHTDGFGPHAAIVVAAVPQPYEEALEYVRPDGVVVAVGLPGGAKIKADVFDTVTTMKQIRGSYVGSKVDMQEAVDIASRGCITGKIQVMGLSELPQAYDALQAMKVSGRIVLDTSR